MGAVSIGLKASLPIFLRRYDALTVFRFSLLTWPVTIGLIPLLNVIARHDARQVFLWVAITFVLFMSRLGSLAFSCVSSCVQATFGPDISYSIVMILTKDHTPTGLALATTNSLSELFQMVGIAVGAPFVRCVNLHILVSTDTWRCAVHFLLSQSLTRYSEDTSGSLSSVFCRSLEIIVPAVWQNIVILRTCYFETHCI